MFSTVLTAAFDDISRLDEDGQVGDILDREFAHLPGFVDDHLFEPERLLQRQHLFPFDEILAVDEEDAQVFVGVRTGNPVVTVVTVGAGSRRAEGQKQAESDN
jgi:hypothetical protein